MICFDMNLDMITIIENFGAIMGQQYSGTGFAALTRGSGKRLQKMLLQKQRRWLLRLA